MIYPETNGSRRRVRRSAKGDPRPRTFNPAALRRLRREQGRQGLEDASYSRPATRADCCGLPRPCPFVGCRHHLYLDVKPSGAITVRWPHLAPWEIPESCALDVAERGDHTLDEVGALLNVSWERIRKMETLALMRLRLRHGHKLAQHLPQGRRRKRPRRLARAGAPGAIPRRQPDAQAVGRTPTGVP